MPLRFTYTFAEVCGLHAERKVVFMPNADVIRMALVMETSFYVNPLNQTISKTILNVSLRVWRLQTCFFLCDLLFAAVHASWIEFSHRCRCHLLLLWLSSQEAEWVEYIQHKLPKQQMLLPKSPLNLRSKSLDSWLKKFVFIHEDSNEQCDIEANA